MPKLHESRLVAFSDGGLTAERVGMNQLRPYYSYLKICKGRYTMGMIFGLLNGLASGLGMPFIAFKLLPMAMPSADRDNRALIGIILLVPTIAVVRGLSQFFSTYFMGYCSSLIGMELRKELMCMMQDLSLSFYHKTRTGQIMARVLNDTSKIAGVVTQSTADLVRQPITIIGAFIWIGYLAISSREIYMLLLVVIILPACILLIRHVGRKISTREMQMGRTEGSLNTVVHENIESARETRAFDLHEREERRFRSKAMQQFKIQMRLLRYKTVISPAIEVVSSVGIAAAILYAAVKGVPAETIGPLLMALYVCYQPVKKLGLVYTSIKRASAAAERIDKLIHQSKDRLAIAENPMPCPTLRDSIDFENVSFTYNKAKKRGAALSEVSVKINRGDVIALVGPSGSGKSTFCNLLARFYDPVEGSIRYDGIGIQEFDENDYRKHMAIVPQDSFLFADTIMNNIRVGRQDASDEEVLQAARKANAHKFIKRLPNGYDTVVAERGASLSGGQRQRIAIARAFLRNSEILILDEATSAIDAKSEEKIHAALTRLFRNKTVIIIAHRYSTIRLAERILLFNEGRIEMDGTDTDLEAGSDFFRALKVSGVEPGMPIAEETKSDKAGES